MTTVTKTREQLIEECQGLVRSLALKLSNKLPKHVELDDLISYGQLGLAEAARDFDPSRGGQFTTFAYYRIRGAMYDGLSKMAWVSRSRYQRIKCEQMANDLLRLEGERDVPANAGLEETLGWLKNVTSSLAIVYLSTVGTQSADGQSLDLEDSRCSPPDAAAVALETKSVIHKLIDQLPAEAQSLIRATYFEGLTLTEAGQRLGIGKSWASRLHAKALQRLGRSLRLAGISD
jgi:RNA polymerase sigma factor for flagellar operon FliA